MSGATYNASGYDDLAEALRRALRAPEGYALIEMPAPCPLCGGALVIAAGPALGEFAAALLNEHPELTEPELDLDRDDVGYLYCDSPGCPVCAEIRADAEGGRP